jgi:DNA-nicking Smr family endonuclease
MRRRVTSEVERELFKAAVEGKRELDGETRSKHKPAKSVTSTAEARGKSSAPRATGLSGLDGRTQERLRRGLLEPEARLDMHGMTQASAHRALLTFVRSAHARGNRLVLVVTGKGSKTEAIFSGETVGHGVLKMMTPRWLDGLDDMVAGWRAAHRRHGGDGALYVYLKKPRR